MVAEVLWVSDWESLLLSGGVGVGGMDVVEDCDILTLPDVVVEIVMDVVTDCEALLLIVVEVEFVIDGDGDCEGVTLWVFDRDEVMVEDCDCEKKELGESLLLVDLVSEIVADAETERENESERLLVFDDDGDSVFVRDSDKLPDADTAFDMDWDEVRDGAPVTLVVVEREVLRDIPIDGDTLRLSDAALLGVAEVVRLRDSVADVDLLSLMLKEGDSDSVVV